MGDPGRPERWGEIVPQEKIDRILEEIKQVRDLVVISGGFAWHLLSPPHVEEKHLHDHRDIDVFVRPADFAELVTRFAAQGFMRVWTRFDGQSKDFYRYTKYFGEGKGKCLVDTFVAEVPFIEVQGYRVVEPSYLLGLYGKKHSSEQCVAVQAAKELIKKGKEVVGDPSLIIKLEK